MTRAPAPSSRIEALPRSGVRAIMELALGMDGVLRLDVGDPDFPTPAHIVDAAARAGHEGFTHYGPSSGLPTLRALLAERVSRRFGVDRSADEVVVTTGACGAIFLALLSLLDPGDELLIPDPGWSNYPPMAVAVGATPVPYRLDAGVGFEPDLADVERRIGPRTRALLINSPGNPTGAVFSAGAMRGLVDLAAAHGLWVISDECYDELVFEGEHLSASALGSREQTVTVFSFSKTYAMTGWRVGYAVSPASFAPLIARAQEPVLSCPATPAQKAAEAALTGPQAPVDDMRAAYRARRDRALERLDAHGVPYVRPNGAFYIMVDVSSSGESSAGFARRLLLEDRVAVVPGSAFGGAGEGMVRVSLAAAESDIVTGVDRLAAALQRSDVTA